MMEVKGVNLLKMKRVTCKSIFSPGQSCKSSQIKAHETKDFPKDFRHVLLCETGARSLNK